MYIRKLWAENGHSCIKLLTMSYSHLFRILLNTTGYFDDVMYYAWRNYVSSDRKRRVAAYLVFQRRFILGWMEDKNIAYSLWNKLQGDDYAQNYAGIMCQALPAGHLDQVGKGSGIQILGMRQYCRNIWNAETYSLNNSSFSEGKLGLSRGNGNQAASTLQGRLWV